MPSVVVDYRLDGAGWATCDVGIGEKSTTTTASFLHDALKDLLSATINILQGVNESKADFAEEPGWFRWLLQRFDDDRLLVRVLWTDADNADEGELGGWIREFRDFAELEAVIASFQGSEVKLLSIEPDGRGGAHHRYYVFPPPWETRLEAECSLKDFGQAVCNTAQRLLEKYGLQGYKDDWMEHDFPLAELRILQGLLGQPFSSEPGH